MSERNQLVAGGILLASTVVFGAFMGGVIKGGLRAEDYTDADLDDPWKEWTAAVLAFGLTGLSLDAFGRWVEHYSRTGVMLSAEQILQQYE